MKEENNSSLLSRLRRSDKIILGVISLLLLVTVVLGILDRCGISLINTPIMLFLPVMALFGLICWGAYALIRRMRSGVVKIVAGICVAMVMFLLMALAVTYLSFVTYTVMPHQYKVLADPEGKHRLVVLWRFDTDAEHNEATIEARKAARLEAYPESDPETTPDDICVSFDAYPRVLGMFYRSKADVEGTVSLAYTGNIVPMDTLKPAAQEAAETAETAEPAETAEGAASTEAPVSTEAAEPVEVQVIETPHGTMMLEWLDDNKTAHFYVKDPGVAEGGECTVRFAR